VVEPTEIIALVTGQVVVVISVVMIVIVGVSDWVLMIVEFTKIGGETNVVVEVTGGGKGAVPEETGIGGGTTTGAGAVPKEIGIGVTGVV